MIALLLAFLLAAECSSQRCEAACAHLLELGCYGPDVQADRAACVRTCRRSDAPIDCAMRAGSCEDVAWCVVEAAP